MKLYVLKEEFFNIPNDDTGSNIEIYATMEEANKKKQELINDNITNYGFVVDSQDANRLFYSYQENWNDYIEYTIEERDVETEEETKVNLKDYIQMILECYDEDYAEEQGIDKLDDEDINNIIANILDNEEIDALIREEIEYYTSYKNEEEK